MPGPRLFPNWEAMVTSFHRWGDLRPSVAVWRGLSLLLFPMLPVIACTSPTGPELVRAQLLNLDVWAFDAPTGLMVTVSGIAEDPIGESQALVATVQVGERTPVEMQLSREICGDSAPEMRACRRLGVMLAPGADHAELHSLLANLDAAWILGFTIGGQAAGVIHVFSGSVLRAMDLISGHPAVEVVELEGVGAPGEGLPGGFDRLVGVTVPTSATDPTPPSARISAADGEEIVVRYRQADGSELIATHTVGSDTDCCPLPMRSRGRRSLR